jgi:hypothetical protein
MTVYSRGDDVAFVGQLDTINALADASPGFVWRLQTDGGNATSAVTPRPSAPTTTS